MPGKERMSEDKIIVSGLSANPKRDKNVVKVIDQLEFREMKGYIKYGVTTERGDLSTLEWLQHFQEELMDACVYIEKLKGEIK